MAEKAATALKEASVLIVEDDTSLVRLFSMLLRTEGYEVHTSLDGAAGLVALREDKPDVVILDLAMPVIDGRTFFRLARESGFDGPIVICSAYGAQAAQRELGADAFISKPFDPEVLLDTLHGLLHHP